MIDQVTDGTIGAAIVSLIAWGLKQAGWIHIGRRPTAEGQQMEPTSTPMDPSGSAGGNGNGKLTRAQVEAMLAAHETGCVRVMDQRLSAIHDSITEDRMQQRDRWIRVENALNKISDVERQVAVTGARLDDHIRSAHA